MHNEHPSHHRNCQHNPNVSVTLRRWMPAEVRSKCSMWIMDLSAACSLLQYGVAIWTTNVTAVVVQLLAARGATLDIGVATNTTPASVSPCAGG